jgi:hypothetical protein
MAKVITEDQVDAALSRVEALDEDQEQAQFEAFVARQPHVAGLVAAIADDIGEDAELLAMWLLFRIDAMFTEAHGAPLGTIAVEEVKAGYERTIAAIEAELGLPEADLLRRIVQPVVMQYVIETLSDPPAGEDEDGPSLSEEDLAELVMVFRTATELFDGKLAG